MDATRVRAYWNDPAIERAKPYAVTSVDDRRLLAWLRNESNLERCFLDGIRFLREALHWQGGRVLDVAAGNCWTSALLSRVSGVEQVVAMDYSRHRIEQYAPIVIRQMDGVAQRISRRVADIRDHPFDQRFDLVVFCQALYMFADATDVLRRCFELMTPGGVVMVACERVVPQESPLSRAHWMALARTVVRRRTDDSGRVRMRDKDYRRSLTRAGFRYRFQLLDYPTVPSWTSWPAGNHFGTKEV